jgi:hypothetical protein
MRDGTDEIIKTELYREIEKLEKQYRAIKDYLSGKETESLEIIETLRGFKSTLNKISIHILTLYTLESQKTKITWDSLFTNIDHALEQLQTSRSNPRQTIQLAIDMSEPKIEEIMSYLLTLKNLCNKRQSTLLHNLFPAFNQIQNFLHGFTTVTSQTLAKLNLVNCCLLKVPELASPACQVEYPIDARTCAANANR